MLVYFAFAILVALIIVTRLDDAEESIGFGGTVDIDDGGTGAAPGASFVNVVNVVTLGVPSIKTNTTESKRLTLARIRKIATIEDGGEFSIKQQFTNAGFARMETIRTAKARHTFRITVPDDDSDTVIEVVCLITENKTDSLESEKITEFETMLSVAE